MTDYLQISQQALDLDWQAWNYNTADITADSVVIIDGNTAHQLSTANLVDGVAVGVTSATGAAIVGVAMETIRGTTFTGGGTSGGFQGTGRIRSHGLCKCIAS